MSKQRVEEHPYPVEPMPEWFVDAVCSIEPPQNEAVAVVGRFARQYTYAVERMMDLRARLPLSNSAIALECNIARAMANLLWAALSALEAADVVHTEPSSLPS